MRARTYSVTIVIALAVLAVCAIVPQSAHAHGSGLTVTSTSTDYFVDVDYSAFSIYAGEVGRFDFKLFKDAARTRPVDFSQVWVRIVRASDIAEGDTIFSGWIAKAVFGSTGFSIALPKSGAYTLIVRYSNDDAEIIQASLPLTVDPPYRDPFVFGREFWYGTASGALALVAIIGVPVLFFTRRRP